MASENRTSSFLNRRAALMTAIAAIGVASAGSAVAGSNPVDLQVVDRETGQPIRMWRRHGRLFIAGEPGERYSLRVSNHTAGRVLVVLSVDGVNILTGETAAYGQRGYVFSPYETYDLTGWRKSLSEVAAFSFAPLPQSYAAQTGRPGEVGVIGMAVFKEKVSPPPPPPINVEQPRYDRMYTGRAESRLAAPAPPPPPPPPLQAGAAREAVAQNAPKAKDASKPMALADRVEEKLGTAHGPREVSVTRIVAFERASPYPESVRQIEYDTYANLVSRGVIPQPAYEHQPQPFPSDGDGRGFVPDPPWGR